MAAYSHRHRPHRHRRTCRCRRRCPRLSRWRPRAPPNLTCSARSGTSSESYSIRAVAFSSRLIGLLEAHVAYRFDADHLRDVFLLRREWTHEQVGIGVVIEADFARQRRGKTAGLRGGKFALRNAQHALLFAQPNAKSRRAVARVDTAMNLEAWSDEVGIGLA